MEVKNTMFVWIPKTAGNSMYEVFLKYGCNKYHQPDLAYKCGPIFTTVHEHPVAAWQKRWITNKQWKESFKFCFVRNPWERMISHYFHCKSVKYIEDVSFRDFVVDLDEMTQIARTRAIDQTWWMVDKEDNYIVDFIGRYENLENDWNTVCKEIGIESKLPLTNTTNHNDYNRNNWRSHYDNETISLVGNMNSRTINRFGYKFK